MERCSVAICSCVDAASGSGAGWGSAPPGRLSPVSPVPATGSASASPSALSPSAALGAQAGFAPLSAAATTTGVEGSVGRLLLAEAPGEAGTRDGAGHGEAPASCPALDSAGTECPLVPAASVPGLLRGTGRAIRGWRGPMRGAGAVLLAPLHRPPALAVLAELHVESRGPLAAPTTVLPPPRGHSGSRRRASPRPPAAFVPPPPASCSTSAGRALTSSRLCSSSSL
mmetsp:Transcript_64891/g.208980  ORF Transcript_64891/g.208980 Transcript_64891/m.208980 type:complete len:227 (-) Transcript_64891:1136-1816(-)